MNRHIIASLTSLVVVATVGYVWHTTFSAPIEITDVTLKDEIVPQGDKLTVYYRYKINRYNCVGKIIGEMHDGIETVRVYEAPLEIPDHVVEIRSQASIGLPAYTKPGKAKLNLHAEFICNKVNTLDPIKIDMGDHTFNVSDPDAESKARLIGTLRAQIYELNVRVLNLSVKVQRLENVTEQKTELKVPDEPVRTQVLSNEKRLSTNIPEPEPNIPEVEPTSTATKVENEEAKPNSLYALFMQMIE